MAKNPFASTPEFAPASSGVFNTSRVLAGLVSIAALTFGLAYYVPLQKAHDTLARAHDSLSSSNAGVTLQLEKTTQQLMDTQKQRDELAAKLKAIDDAKEASANAIGAAADRVKERVAKLPFAKQLAITDHAGASSISIDMSKLFKPQDVTVHPPGRKLLCAIAPALKDLEAQIEVRAFTREADVKNPQLKADYPTGWDLSSARAANSVRVLESCGVSAEHLRATGYANHHLDKPIDEGSDGLIRLYIAPASE
ncbi:MAG TPA: OmpA family protein [Polyangiaceae bacterium]|jgi:flagellar motor protein MotB|nr:OmpA family protein [Polyangiaceae bacterium]